MPKSTERVQVDGEAVLGEAYVNDVSSAATSHTRRRFGRTLLDGKTIANRLVAPPRMAHALLPQRLALCAGAWRAIDTRLGSGPPLTRQASMPARRL